MSCSSSRECCNTKKSECSSKDIARCVVVRSDKCVKTEKRRAPEIKFVGKEGCVGKSGARGPDGAVGKQGCVGKSGARGADGPIGKQGRVGRPGVRGPDGPVRPEGCGVMRVGNFVPDIIDRPVGVVRVGDRVPEIVNGPSLSGCVVVPVVHRHYQEPSPLERPVYPSLPPEGEEEAPEETAEELLCILCSSRQRRAIVIPCGHYYSCLTCMVKHQPRVCALCSGEVTQVVRVFQS